MDPALLYKFWSAIGEGLCYAFLALGIVVSFRILKFPDLTADGSFTLGAVASALWILHRKGAGTALLVGAAAGGIAGLGTAGMSRYLRIPRILAGILSLMALYSINLRLLGAPNQSLDTDAVLFAVLPEGSSAERAAWSMLLVGGVLLVVTVALCLFLDSEPGLSLRATGGNPKMATSNGVNTAAFTFLGLGLSNALIGLSGSFISQRSYFADVGMGTGVVIVGIASLFLGQLLLRGRHVHTSVAAAILGAVVYKGLVALALEVGLDPRDLRLLTTLLVIGGIGLGQLRNRGLASNDDLSV